MDKNENYLKDKRWEIMEHNEDYPDHEKCLECGGCFLCDIHLSNCAMSVESE